MLPPLLSPFSRFGAGGLPGWGGFFFLLFLSVLAHASGKERLRVVHYLSVSSSFPRSALPFFVFY